MNDELVGQILGALVNNKNDNDGFGGGNGALWLLVFIILFGGWGGRGYGNNGQPTAGGDALYPWINQSEQVSNGFRDQMINNGITGVQQSVTGGFADVLQALCAGFGGVNMNMANGFAQAEIAANGRQMAGMQQLFGMQTAIMQGFNADQAEHCADRTAFSDGIRDVIASQLAASQRQIDNQNMWGQRIADQLCQYRIEDKDNEIAQLRQQVQMQNLAASQAAQTAAILANNEAQTTMLEQYLAPVPRPAYIVQGPNCCTSNFGCGCAA